MVPNLLMRAALLGAATAELVAQPAASPTPGQQKEMEQVALARARTELLEQAASLPVFAGLTLSSWLRQDAEVERALRLWVRTLPRQGKFRFYSCDAVCEADVRLEPGELCEKLAALLEDHPTVGQSLGIDGSKLKAAAANWPILWATGRCAAAAVSDTRRPPGWRDVTNEGLELARAAAIADAYQVLLSELGQLPLAQGRHLRDFLDSSAQVREAVQAELSRAAKVRVEFAPDQVAVGEVRIEMRDLLRILTRVCQEQYRGSEFEAADFRQMALSVQKTELIGTGLGVPPVRSLLRGRYQPVEYDRPAWTRECLVATGRYEPVDEEAPEPAARTEAARLDGIDQLYQRISRLELGNGITVADFLSYHQDLKDDVVLFLSGTRVISPATVDPAGGVEVKVELPLGRLWEILRTRMKLEEVEPPASSPAPQ